MPIEETFWSSNILEAIQQVKIREVFQEFLHMLLHLGLVY